MGSKAESKMVSPIFHVFLIFGWHQTPPPSGLITLPACRDRSARHSSSLLSAHNKM